jgi:hypothetical protein
VEVRHSTATLSPAALLGLYGLRLMHRLNISLSRSGLRAGRAIFFSPLEGANPNPICTLEYHELFASYICSLCWSARSFAL